MDCSNAPNPRTFACNPSRTVMARINTRFNYILWATQPLPSMLNICCKLSLFQAKVAHQQLDLCFCAVVSLVVYNVTLWAPWSGRGKDLAPIFLALVLLHRTVSSQFLSHIANLSHFPILRYFPTWLYSFVICGGCIAFKRSIV